MADAMRHKALRSHSKRPVFEPDTERFWQLLTLMLDRGRVFWTGGSKLRVVLDGIAHSWTHGCFCYDVVNTHNSMSLYFGWKYTLQKRMDPCKHMTLLDAAQIREFVDKLDAALDCAVDLAAQLHTDHLSDAVHDAVRGYRRHINEFRALYLDWCVRTIQAAWRRARDEPGYALWRKRMLAEFQELSDMMQM